MSRAAVLVVDDDPIVLRAVERTMREHFDITCASSSKDAIVALGGDTRFAVIVSDLRMPGGSGIELLQHSRTHHPDVVRIMLSGVARLQDAVAAVNDGHVFRLLIKPFASSAMRLTLVAATEQNRLVMSERVLLEETLQGCIKALTDLLAITQPMAFGRALRMQRHCADLAVRIGLARHWDIEVAALLSQIGCVTLDVDTLDRWYHNKDLTPYQRAQIDRLPDVAESLIAGIPRLETVRSILRRQFEPFNALEMPVGARILAIARDFDVLIAEGNEPDDALTTMDGRTNRYDANLLRQFRAIRSATSPTSTMRDMPLSQIAESMVFAVDVHAPNGMLVIARGQRVTAALISRLQMEAFALSATTSVKMIVSTAPHNRNGAFVECTIPQQSG